MKSHFTSGYFYVFILTGFLLITPPLLAQNPVLKWAHTFGSTLFDNGYLLTPDNSGNIILSGRIGASGPIDFDPGPGTRILTCQSSWCMLVAKYDPQGNLIFAFNLGGGNGAARSVLVDADDNIYLAGAIATSSGTDFDPGPGTHVLYSDDNFSDIFLAKYDPTGNLKFAFLIGGTSFDQANDMMFDEDGNLLVVGSYKHASDFDPGPGTAILNNPNSSTNAFIATYDTAGNYLSALWLSEGSATNGDALEIDVQGNKYIAGGFYDSVSLDPGSTFPKLVSEGDLDGFLAKYDTAGNLVFQKTCGGMGAMYVTDLARDENGSIYLGGLFTGEVDLDPGNPGGEYICPPGKRAGCFIKFSPAGNFIYGIGYGSTFSSVQSIRVDENGMVYVVGNFSDTVDFQPGADTYLVASTDTATGFVAIYDSLGNVIKVIAMESIGASMITDVFIGPLGELYITGDFMEVIDLDPGVGVRADTSEGYNDIFLIKIATCLSNKISAQVTPEQCLGDEDGAIQAIASGGQPPYQYLWSDGDTSTDLSMLQPGQYSLTITDAEGCAVNDSFNITAGGQIDSVEIMWVGTDTLAVADTFDTYVWLFDGDTIVGASGPEIAVEEAGLYTVMVSIATCSAQSHLEVINIGIGNEPEKLSFTVYPNPVTDKLVVSVNGKTNGVIAEFKLINVMGGAVRSITADGTGRIVIDVSDIPQGYYILRMVTYFGHFDQGFLKM